MKRDEHSEDAVGDLSGRAARGTMWATADKFGVMGLQFVFNLVLARLLTPGDFGVVGMLTVFLAVSNVLIDSGFAQALIQRKEVSEREWSSVFYANMGVAVALYGILWCIAPWVGRYFHMPEAGSVLRGIGLTLPLGAAMTIQITRLRKQFRFRTIAVGEVGAYVVAGSVATVLAWRGWGVWSLVAMQVMQMVIVLVIFGFLTRWHPSREFSAGALRSLFGFGGYLLAASVLQEIAKNLQGLIIGRRFSASAMGYYTQAYKLDRISSYTLPQVVVQVMFPVYSVLQDDEEKLRGALGMDVRILGYLLIPLMGALALAAPTLINVLYGEKWLAAVPYFRVLCVAGMFACLQNVNFYAVAARGRSRLLFLWSIYKWSFLLVALLTGAEIGGIMGLMWAMVVSEANIYVVNAALAGRVTGLGLGRQLMSLLPGVLLAGVCMGGGWILAEATGHVVAAAAALAAYGVLSRLLGLRGLKDTMEFVKKIRG